MTVQDVIDHLDELAPLAYAEDFDNVTLDTLESVVDEAIKNKCNLIVSFHPIIFKGLKKLTGSSYVERVVIKALKHNIAIFAIHTALDNALQGVNAMMCKKLGLENNEILMPQTGTIKKLTTYVPTSKIEHVRAALFNVGAGNIGNYSNCSFNVEGMGSFKGNEYSNPTTGKKGKTHFEEEIKLTITFPKHLESKVIRTLFRSHPYEEVAYEVITLENKNQHIGMGMVGQFEKPMKEKDFLEHLKKSFKTPVIRHSNFIKRSIKKVAVLGGSGSFAIQAAKACGADAYVTADLKYHDFFTAEDHILLTDIGHYESEQYTKNLIASYLKKKIPNFAIILSKTRTNPVKYF